MSEERDNYRRLWPASVGTKLAREPRRLRWNCACSNPPFEGEEMLAQDGAIRCPNCQRPLSGDPA